jgi:SAM-dependent methyltransferase
MLAPGKRGLGFAVGTEPLPSLFASLGCEVVASDQAPEGAAKDGWTNTNEHAAGLKDLLHPAICAPDVFYRRTRFRVVDMNHIPSDLRGFDFTWSSCSFEHLGDIRRGLQFLKNMLECLRPGGVAVHTTEYNISSNSSTLSEGPCVIFRRRDLEEVAGELRAAGHHLADFDFNPGAGPADQVVARPPYQQPPQLKLELGGYVATSMGIIITKECGSGLKHVA